MKAPESKRLKLKYDQLLSNFAFNFSLRHYISEFSYPEHPELFGIPKKFGKSWPAGAIQSGVPPGAVTPAAAAGNFTTTPSASAAAVAVAGASSPTPVPSRQAFIPQLEDAAPRGAGASSPTPAGRHINP